jgi:pterin-4a-carbinolamine dehydratase
MKRPIKIALWGIVVLFFAAAVVLHISKDRLVRAATVRILGAATQFGVELDEVEVGIFARTIDFKGLRLENPEPFEIPEAITISHLHVAWTWAALWSRTAEFRRIHIRIPTVTIVRPETGPSNFEVLERNISGWKGADAQATAASVVPVPQFKRAISTEPAAGSVAETSHAHPAAEVRIGELKIHLGTVYVADYKLGRSKHATAEFEIDHEEVFTDVTDVDTVAAQLAARFGVNFILSEFGEGFELSSDAEREMKSALDETVEKLMRQDQDIEVEDAEEGFKDLLPRRTD